MHPDAMLRQVVRTAQQLGCGEAVAPIARVLAREEPLSGSLLEHRAGADRAFAAAVERAAAGGVIDADIVQLGQVVTLAEAQHGARGPALVRIAEHAALVITREAHAAGASCGPRLLDGLIQVAERAVAEAAALGIGPVPWGAWRPGRRLPHHEELLAVFQTFEAAHAAYTTVRTLGWLGNRLLGGPQWFRYRNPLRVPGPAADLHRRPPAEVVFAGALTSGAGPGMLAPGEAETRYERWLEGRRKVEAGPTLTPHDHDEAMQQILDDGARQRARKGAGR